MKNVVCRLVGEWKALVSACKHWRRISPCVKCGRCGNWFDGTDLCTNGMCWECDHLTDSETEAIADEAWAQGHAAGWHNCVCEMNRQKINSVVSEELQIRLAFDGEVPL
jgi:hypothetical protein